MDIDWPSFWGGFLIAGGGLLAQIYFATQNKIKTLRIIDKAAHTHDSNCWCKPIRYIDDPYTGSVLYAHREKP